MLSTLDYHFILFVISDVTFWLALNKIVSGSSLLVDILLLQINLSIYILQKSIASCVMSLSLSVLWTLLCCILESST